MAWQCGIRACPAGKRVTTLAMRRRRRCRVTRRKSRTFSGPVDAFAPPRTPPAARSGRSVRAMIARLWRFLAWTKLAERQAGLGPSISRGSRRAPAAWIGAGVQDRQGGEIEVSHEVNEGDRRRRFTNMRIDPSMSCAVAATCRRAGSRGRRRMKSEAAVRRGRLRRRHRYLLPITRKRCAASVMPAP